MGNEPPEKRHLLPCAPQLRLFIGLLEGEDRIVRLEVVVVTACNNENSFVLFHRLLILASDFLRKTFTFRRYLSGLGHNVCGGWLKEFGRTRKESELRDARREEEITFFIGSPILRRRLIQLPDPFSPERDEVSRLTDRHDSTIRDDWQRVP